MKTYWKWTVLLVWVATSNFASYGAANNSGAGAERVAVVPSNPDIDREKQKQKQDALKAAQKEDKEVLQAFPHVKRLEGSYNQAKISYDRTVARETRAIKDEMSRLLSMIIQGKDRPLAEYRRLSFEISMAILKSLNDIESLKQQIANSAAATNDMAAANSNSVALETELAKERQKFEALKGKKAELAPESANESVGDDSSRQKALEQKYGLLQRQLWEMPNTNTNLNDARAELNRWRSRLELAIATNAPLKEAKHKLESAYKESSASSDSMQ